MPLGPRSASATQVVLVRVAFASDFADAPPQNVDQPMKMPKGGWPESFSTLVPQLSVLGDLTVTKRQWSALHDTELELQLRRRGIKTVVLGGIATNFGVESTAREAWEHNYDVIVLEDLCATLTAELHEMAMSRVFPRNARVTTSARLRFD